MMMIIIIIIIIIIIKTKWKIYQWTPHGRRRRGKPQQSGWNQVTDFMKSRNMEEDMAENRYLWRLGID